MDKTQVQALSAQREFLSMDVFTFFVLVMNPRRRDAGSYG
jgi:hypothetical protein